MTSTSSWRVPVLLALVLVAADQATKHWAVNELADNRTIEIVWTLQFNLAFNSGMAFSRAEGLGPVIAVVATVVIVWLLASLRGVGGRLATLGMGFVIGGAAGNLVDRLFRGDAWLRGSVVDFIDFQWFPIFNVADMAINVGAGMLILNAILASRHGSEEVDGDGDQATADAGPDTGETDATTDDGDLTDRVVVDERSEMLNDDEHDVLRADGDAERSVDAEHRGE